MSKPQKRVGRNAAFNLGGSLIPILLSLLTIPAYLKLIGPERYGVLAIAWLMLGYLGLFDLGLGRATAYRIAALRDAPAGERADTLWTALVVNLGLGLIGGLILWAAAYWFFSTLLKVDPAIRIEAIAALPWLALTVPVATMIGVLSGALQGLEQFGRTNSVSVISTLLFQLLPLGIAWSQGPYLPHLLLAALAARCVAIAVLWILCHRELTRGQPVRVDRARVAQLISFGGWVSVTSFIGMMLVATDRFLIGGVLGATAVTLYSLPFHLAQRIGILPQSLTTALFPRLSAAAPAEQQRLGRVAFATLASLITVPVLVGVLLIGPFLELWVGEEIGREAAPIGRLLLVGFWLNAFALIFFTRLQASGRPDLVAKILLVQVVPYLIGLFTAMKLFGLLGCAAMFLIRCLADLLLLSWALEKRLVGIGLLSVNLLLLLLAAALPAVADPPSPIWMAGSAALLLVTASLGLATVPHEVRTQLSGFLFGRGLARARRER